MAANFPILSWLVGKPDAALILVEFKAPFDFTVPPSLAGTTSVIGTNPTSTAVYNVNKNGSSIGTISVATNGAVTLAGAGASFSAVSGDVFQLVAPDSQDSTLADVAIVVFTTA